MRRCRTWRVAPALQGERALRGCWDEAQGVEPHDFDGGERATESRLGREARDAGGGEQDRVEGAFLEFADARWHVAT